MKNQSALTNVLPGSGRFGPALAALLLLTAATLTSQAQSLPASLLPAGPAQPQYRFVEIPVPGPSYAIGINDSGMITGYNVDPATGDVASYLFRNGVLTLGISAPGATITSLGPANNLGVEGGNYGGATNQQPAFYDIRRGTFTPLPEIPGMPMNFGDGINDLGHASGVAYSGGNWFTGGTGMGLNWIWDGHKYNFFSVPGAVNGTVAGGINDLDQVTGYYIDNSGLPKGFVKDGTNYVTLDVPGSIFTVAFGINNLGVVTGQYLDMSGNFHGYYWHKGTYVTVDTNIPGAVGVLWFNSNNQGDLAGFFEDTNSVPHAVIAMRVK